LACVFQEWEFMVQGVFQRKVWLMLFSSISWTLWLTRNDAVFNNTQLGCETVFFLVLSRCLWPLLNQLPDLLKLLTSFSWNSFGFLLIYKIVAAIWLFGA
jgi:hypothetical protein